MSHQSFLAEIQKNEKVADTGLPKLASEYEGYAKLLEEVDELFDFIKREYDDPLRKPGIRFELIDIAAVCLRCLTDLCEEEPPILPSKK